MNWMTESDVNICDIISHYLLFYRFGNKTWITKTDTNCKADDLKIETYSENHTLTFRNQNLLIKQPLKI